MNILTIGVLRHGRVGNKTVSRVFVYALANAHGLSSQKYVEQLIAACDDIVEQEADAL
jgi:hypothetical protein